MRRTTSLAAAAAAALAVLAAGAPAASAERLTIRGTDAPGPDRYDRLWVETYGSSKARTVFVIVPGTNAGARSVEPVARDLVKRVKGLQVWAVDRRQEALEDRSGFAKRTAREVSDYYLGFRYRQADPREVPFVADWGLRTQTEDLRRVVLRARDGGKRRVVLGGHSRGASQAAAYAAWDFKGRPGWRDLSGIVLIDGGLRGFTGSGREAVTEASAREDLAEIRAGRLFNDQLGLGIPSIAQVFLEVGARLALDEPSAPSVLQGNPLIPASFKPPFRVTNRAALGYIFDKETSPPGFNSLRANMGSLAPSGDPRDWVSGERTPISRFIGAFAGRAKGPDATEWYYPSRLVLDIAAADPMARTPAANLLGLRLWHARSIRTPLYAFQTDLTNGRVAAGARALADGARIRRPVIVSDTGMSHLDPVLASPSRNTFLRTVAPFLRERAGRR
jgi:hypothetical protein